MKRTTMQVLRYFRLRWKARPAIFTQSRGTKSTGLPEALRNALRHADAQHIEVEIRYDERQLRLRLRDDGKGIDPKVLSDDGHEGHYGLRGMRERAKLLGGKLAVWSERDSGTEVELIIPAAHAYTASPGLPRSWLAERFFGKTRRESDE